MEQRHCDVVRGAVVSGLCEAGNKRFTDGNDVIDVIDGSASTADRIDGAFDVTVYGVA